MQHELKISPEYFDAVDSDIKPFEVRRNDRPFRVGDSLWLREFIDPSSQLYAGVPYTGRTTHKIITYILDNKEYCPEGFVILGLKPL